MTSGAQSTPLRRPFMPRSYPVVVVIVIAAVATVIAVVVATSAVIMFCKVQIVCWSVSLLLKFRLAMLKCK